jgi:hypothetical protein
MPTNSPKLIVNREHLEQLEAEIANCELREKEPDPTEVIVVKEKRRTKDREPLHAPTLATADREVKVNVPASDEKRRATEVRRQAAAAERKRLEELRRKAAGSMAEIRSAGRLNSSRANVRFSDVERELLIQVTSGIDTSKLTHGPFDRLSFATNYCVSCCKSAAASRSRSTY